jgi:hypothetical protein
MEPYFLAFNSFASLMAPRFAAIDAYVRQMQDIHFLVWRSASSGD